MTKTLNQRISELEKFLDIFLEGKDPYQEYAQTLSDCQYHIHNLQYFKCSWEDIEAENQRLKEKIKQLEEKNS